MKGTVSWWFLLFELFSFFRTENKLRYHEKVCKNEDFWGIFEKGCMKYFCGSLKEHVTDTINFEKKKKLPVIKNLKLHQNTTTCYIWGKRFPEKSVKEYQKRRDHCHFTGKYRGEAHSICNLIFNVPIETPVVFHNCSNYDYHFIMKKLANEFEEQFECLGENTEKYNNYPAPIEKEYW